MCFKLKHKKLLSTLSAADLTTFVQVVHCFHFSNICNITSTTTTTSAHHPAPTPRPHTRANTNTIHSHKKTPTAATVITISSTSTPPAPTIPTPSPPPGALSVVTEDNSQGTIGIGSGVRCCVKLGAMETLNASRNRALYLNLQSHMHFLGRDPFYYRSWNEPIGKFNRIAVTCDNNGEN